MWFQYLNQKKHKKLFYNNLISISFFKNNCKNFYKFSLKTPIVSKMYRNHKKCKIFVKKLKEIKDKVIDIKCKRDSLLF